MKKIIFIILFVSTTLFISCSSNEENSSTPETIVPEVIDPRLPNQELFKPSVRLIPKNADKSSEIRKHLVKAITQTTIQDAHGNDVQNDFSETQFSYDSKGRLSSIDSNANSLQDDLYNVVKYNYNTNNELISVKYPNDVVEINDKGYITKIRDNSNYGKILNLYYDEIGRLIKQEGVIPYNQELFVNPDGSYETYPLGKKESITLYKYIDDKIFIEISEIQKDYITHTRTENGVIKTIKDRVVQTTNEITVDYSKAGVYSSESVFRRNFGDWLHLKEVKVKIVTDGVIVSNYSISYDSNYDINGYLTQINQVLTDSYSGKQTFRKTTYTYE